MRSRLSRIIFIAAVLILVGCTGLPIDQVELMPAPDVYGNGLLNPLPEYNPLTEVPYHGILYATDRRPAIPDDPEKYYLNDRGHQRATGPVEEKTRLYNKCTATMALLSPMCGHRHRVGLPISRIRIPRPVMRGIYGCYLNS